jgi:hypothetical protein
LNASLLSADIKCHIYACEQNLLFASISKEFLSFTQSHHQQHQVEIIEKHSNSLKLKDDFKSMPVDLIITEIFDDGLLGERSLDTFYNAIVVNHLQEEERCLIIPKNAKIFICPFESKEIRQSTFYERKFKKEK